MIRFIAVDRDTACLLPTSVGVPLLRADVATNDACHRALMRTRQVIGPPTVMMFDTAGRERRAARLLGEFKVDQLLQRQLGPGSQA